MNFFKKILLAIIIIIFSVLLFYLYKRRLEIMDSFNEGFMTPNNILALNRTVNTLPLHQYCIKASYNSALANDNTISLDMLDTVLTRGCRFIDFEVYFVNRLPVVAYSTDASYTSITTSNYVPLKSILDRAIVTAFTSSPTKADPLFIQLRIKAMDHNVYITLYREVAKILDSLFPSNTHISRFYKNNATGSAVIVDKNTLLKDIMGRVIIVSDVFTNDQYNADTTCNSDNTAVFNKYISALNALSGQTDSSTSDTVKSCYDLKKYVNMNNGNEFLRTNDYTTVLGECNNPPHIMNDNISTNVTSMRFVSPGPNISGPNPPIREFIINHGCQIIAYQYYHDDSGLEDCEQFFSDNKFAFVPISKALRYFNKKAEQENG
jgi:hypothetical protein